MAIEAFLARYGLAAIFVGAGVEGEAVVVTGGLLAHQGIVPLWGAIVAAVAGSFVADQIFFQIGRRYRDHPRVRRIMARPAFAKALSAFERHPAWFTLIFRFLYGVRTISPIAVGTTNVAMRTFLPLNLLAAAMWGTLFTTLGYVFGDGIEALMGRLKPSPQTLGIIAGVVVLVIAIRWWRARAA